MTLQKRLWRRLKAEIDESITENPPNVEIYREEYERDLRGYTEVCSKQDLVEACIGAGVVYVGDYHTLAQAQRTLVKLLLAVSNQRPAIVLGLEIAHIEHQHHLDAYLAEDLSDERFLRRIDWVDRWDFAWPPYREILRIARRRGIPCLAINSDPKDHDEDHLLERDFRSASVLVDAMEEQPESLFIVFDGDLHVARDHLPLLVDTELRKRGLPGRDRIIVHQNAEEIYWQLAEREQEREVHVVRLAPDAFCVLNASPLEKQQSYLNWVSDRSELELPLTFSSWDLDDGEDDDENKDLGAEYAEQVHQLACTVARFLQLERDDLDAFTLFTINDLDFLTYLMESRGDFTPSEVDDIKRQILANESYFIPKGDIIYLADFSTQNAAEEATHFLHHRCAEYRWERPRDLDTDFYFRVVTEALGYFGSKVIVPTRECWREQDCIQYVQRHAMADDDDDGIDGVAIEIASDVPGSDTGILAALTDERAHLLHRQQVTLIASTLVLLHKRLEGEFLETGRWLGAGKCLTQPTEVHLMLTHMLGHMLGDKLYRGLLAGAIEKSLIRDVLHEPLESKDVALGRYLDLVRRTAQVDHGSSRGERL